jgi:hypothetical protein
MTHNILGNLVPIVNGRVAIFVRATQIAGDSTCGFVRADEAESGLSALQ